MLHIPLVPSFWELRFVQLSIFYHLFSFDFNNQVWTGLKIPMFNETAVLGEAGGQLQNVPSPPSNKILHHAPKPPSIEYKEVEKRNCHKATKSQLLI
jgi:hypothetical protein